MKTPVLADIELLHPVTLVIFGLLQTLLALPRELQNSPRHHPEGSSSNGSNLVATTINEAEQAMPTKDTAPAKPKAAKEESRR